MKAQSLQGRFLRTLAWTSCLLGALVSFVVYRASHAHVRDGGVSVVASMVTAIEKTAAAGAYARDRELLREIVEGLRRHPHVAEVTVVDADGGELLPTVRSAAAAAAEEAPGASSPRAAGAAPAFDHPLVNPFDPSETLGRLRVWLDDRQLEADARQQALMLAGALIVLLVGVMFVFQSLAVRLLSRPMQLLANDLAAMEPGTDARVRVDPGHARDEIGTVASAANSLLELQQRALERERGLRSEIAEMEARYRGIFDSTSAGIFVLSSGRLLHGNPALGRLLGSPDGSMLPAWQDNFIEAVACEPARLLELVDAARQSGQPQSLDLELRRSTGEIVSAHCLVSVGPDADGVERIEGVLYDITARKQAERLAQHRAEHDALTGLKSRAYIESALDHKLALAARTDEAVTLMFLDLDGFKGVNDQWGHAAGDAVLVESAARLRGLFKRESDIVGRLGGDELVVVIDGTHASDPVVRNLALEVIASFRAPFALPGGGLARVGVSVGVASYPRHATSAKTLIEAADAAMYAVKKSGKGGFVIASAHEGAEPVDLPSRAAMAVDDALRDPLTGLPDRRALAACLERARDQGRRSGKIHAVLALDIDQFKVINVARGSRVGDEVLCEVARRLRQSLRGDDLAARTGSDEFMAVVDSGDSSEEGACAVAQSVAEKVQEVIANPIQSSQGPVTVRVSVGFSLLAPDATDAQRALHEAQLALKRAKSSMGAKRVAFEPGMIEGLRQAMSLEADLREALAAGQLELHVQPQVSASGQRHRGEALARWNHPTRGWVPPGQFIPLAEATGLIVDLGRWVLREGCTILERACRKDPRAELSINISAAQFQSPQFVSDVREAIASSGAPADRLILEITETLLIQQIDDVALRMQDLVELGVRFSIDDFGTGFSSMAYLRRLPLYEIKIDRSFIQGLPDDAAAAGIVQSILAMGRHLGLQVVAEGVETAAQSVFLRQHGCPFEQGWLHGRPMPMGDWIDALTFDAVAVPRTAA